MSEDKVRAEFEAWLNSQGLESKWQPERNAYEHFVAHFAYRAWVDSRAEVVVVLPEPMEANPDPLGECAYAQRCRTAIEAAGVKVKS